MYLERMEKDPGVKLSAITYGWAMRGAERAQVGVWVGFYVCVCVYVLL